MFDPRHEALPSPHAHARAIVAFGALSFIMLIMIASVATKISKLRS